MLPFWWALEDIDVHIYIDEHGEVGPPAAHCSLVWWEMIIAEAGKARVQNRRSDPRQWIPSLKWSQSEGGEDPDRDPKAY